jgi:hypothetical protein
MPAASLSVSFGRALRNPTADIAPAERSDAGLFRAVKGATSVVAAGSRPAFQLDIVFFSFKKNLRAASPKTLLNSCRFFYSGEKSEKKISHGGVKFMRGALF